MDYQHGEIHEDGTEDGQAVLYLWSTNGMVTRDDDTGEWLDPDDTKGFNTLLEAQEYAIVLISEGYIEDVDVIRSL